MAESWQNAWVAVLPDFKDFKRTANRDMSGILGAAGTAGGVTAGRNMSGGILGGIKGLAGPIGGAIAALGIGKLVGEAISYGLDSIDLASDLNESFNAVKVTYGADIAKDLEKLAKEAPKSLRVTQRAFNESATRFSAFAKTIVGPGGDIVGFLDELTGRGADFASVYNLDVADALQLFQSGLAGETEPLRQYGLDLSAASVAAFAYANGIGTAGEELTEAEKVQARYGALLEQTALVQGDAEATGSDLAAQQRDLAVAFEEAQTKLGTALLPGFLDLVTYANESIVPALDGVISKVGPILGDALLAAGPKFEELGVKAGPVIDKLVNAAAEDGIPAFIASMDGLVEHAPEWIDAFQRVDTAVFDADQEFRNFQTDLQNSRLDRIQWLEDVLREFRSFWTDLDREMDNWNADMKRGGEDLVNGFIQGIQNRQAGALSAAIGMATTAIRGAKDILGIESPSKVFKEIGGYVSEGMALGIDGSKGKVDSALRSLVSIPTLTARVDAAPIGAGGGIGAGTTINQYITTPPNEDPRVLGRINAREIVAQMAG